MHKYYIILVGKRIEKWALVRPRSRWEKAYNIKIHLKEDCVGFEVLTAVAMKSTSFCLLPASCRLVS
jgi:hypothetical protein